MFHSLIRTLEEIQKEPCRWVKQPVSCFLCFERVNANVPCHANLKMTLQVAYESKFSESCSIIIYCAERTAYTWQRELCSNGSLQAGAALKLSFMVSVQTEGVGWACPALALVPSVCAVVPQQTDAQAARRPSGGSSRSEPATASSSVCPCTYVLSWLCPLGRVKAFPLHVQPCWEVSKSVGSGCTAPQFCIWPLVLLCCAGPVFSACCPANFDFSFPFQVKNILIISCTVFWVCSGNCLINTVFCLFISSGCVLGQSTLFWDCYVAHWYVLFPGWKYSVCIY